MDTPLDDVTLLIKSFLRKDCVDRLIKSIRKFYPTIKIVVVDDSGRDYNFCYDKNIKTYNIGFDSGLSYGRNYGVSKIDTKYFVLLDDDFVFTEKTDLIKMFNILTKHPLDILGGLIYENGKRLDYYGYINYSDGVITCKSGYEKLDEYFSTEIVPNFFMAKTDSIKKHKWCDDLKLCEHTIFFFNILNKLSVGFTEGVIVDHKPIKVGEYKSYREKGLLHLKKWMKKNDIKEIITLDNTKIKI